LTLGGLNTRAPLEPSYARKAYTIRRHPPSALFTATTLPTSKAAGGRLPAIFSLNDSLVLHIRELTALVEDRCFDGAVRRAAPGNFGQEEKHNEYRSSKVTHRIMWAEDYQDENYQRRELRPAFR
jgi:hypothetical protein